MRRGGLVARATTTALAGFALALGGVLVDVSPAHAADFPDVDTEAELNSAIAYAVANPSDEAVVTISGDFALAAGLNPLTTGRLVINGAGFTISSSSVVDGGFQLSGDSELVIDALTLDFSDSDSLITASGVVGDPGASPSVTLTGVYATAGPADIAFDLSDAAFSATATTITDSSFGILGLFSFGTISLNDVTVLDAANCGLEVYLTEDAILTADRLRVERAGCTGLTISTSETASATITNSFIADNAGGVFTQNVGTGTIELRDSTILGSTAENQFTAFGSSGTIRVANSTITGGLDTGFPAITALFADGDVIIENSTVTGNAVTASPVIAIESCGCTGTGEFVLRHTIVAGNIGTGIVSPDLFIDPTVTAALDWSLIGTVDAADTTTVAAIAAGSGNLFDATTPIDPDLSALALNGGTTPNHLPNPTSPVINAGDPAFVAPPATDQRGLARISGGIIDIGSVEVQFTSALVLSRTTTAVGDQITATGTGFPANTAFTMVFNSTPVTLGTATSNASGGLSFAFTVPTSVSAGAHTITATLAGNVVGSAAITVTGLPDTGSDATPTTLIGALLLLTGATAIALRRRRA